MYRKIAYVTFICLTFLTALGCESHWVQRPIEWVDQVQKQNEIAVWFQEAKTAYQDQEYEKAIGLFRKVYAQSSIHPEVPLWIAKSYAKLSQSRENRFAQQKSIEWLYRARLVDPSFNVDLLNEPIFRPLHDQPDFQSLRRSIGMDAKPWVQDWLPIVRNTQKSIEELKIFWSQIQTFLDALKQFSNVVGFKTILFLAITLWIQSLITGLGLPKGVLTFFPAFACVSYFWVWSHRIFSAGETWGGRTIAYVALWCSVFYLAKWIWGRTQMSS